MAMNEKTLAIIAAAKARLAARNMAEGGVSPSDSAAAANAHEIILTNKPTETDKQIIKRVFAQSMDDVLDKATAELPSLPAAKTELTEIEKYIEFIRTMALNERQQDALDVAMRGQSFCLIGAAGTGKTSVTQRIINDLQQAPHVRPFTEDTKMLASGAPGIVVVGYTNKAVNNVKKKLPSHIARHCMTIHKLLEFEPVYEDYIDGETGKQRTKMTFEPARNKQNKLTHISTLISEESSMVGTDLWGQLIDALPNPSQTQFIMLGDLNQLPPVFGPSILGFKLLELRTVELTHVYRQALESPIISLATAVRTNNTMGGRLEDLSRIPSKLTESITVDKGAQGKVTIHPWKKRVEWEAAMQMMHVFLPKIIDNGAYNPEEDMILCPFNKSFGTIELNKIVANHLGKKRGAVVHEIRARLELSYFAEGDRVLYDRHEAIITSIHPTPGYLGKPVQEASVDLDRWGRNKNNPEHAPKQRTAEEIMNAMEQMVLDDAEGKNLASHTIKVLVPDTGVTHTLSSAGDINKLLMGYALTIHKSQGSEWRRVFLFLHNSHAKGTMQSRELLYTGITRAKEELYIICEGDQGKYGNTIKRAADAPVISGTTLKEKAEWFKGKAKALGFATMED